MNKLHFKIDDSTDLYSFLFKLGLAKSTIDDLICHQAIFINQKAVSNNQLLFYLDEITIERQPEKISIPLFCDPLQIIYEDDFFLLVNKPKNMDSLSSKRHYEDNLSSRVAYYYQKKKIQSNIHIVNRLDYLTSGLMIFAKHGLMHQFFQNTKMTKKYLLKVQGHLKDKEGQIILKIKKSENGIKRIVSPDGKTAITNYRVLKENSQDSIIEATLVTGRTHQLRVSFSFLKHPIIGDELYGSSIQSPLQLCCYSLSFVHPITKEHLCFTLPFNF